MKNLKTSSIAFVFLFFSSQICAQLRLPVTNNDLRNNLQKIIADFSNGLNTIKGDTLAWNPQTIEFTTVLEFEGSEENTITQYISPKPIYSWQAVMLTTEDFEEATKKYNWLCRQLKVMTINLGHGYTFSLSGHYQAPAETRKFSTSTFQLTPAATNLPRLKIEASMQFYFPEWKVNLVVYQKEREDNERGDINEE
jgi:hypothetical protein